MKISRKRINQIIIEERLRAMVMSDLYFSENEFKRLIESLGDAMKAQQVDTGLPGLQSREWWTEEFEKGTIFYNVASAAALRYDAASGKISKEEYVGAMTKNTPEDVKEKSVKRFEKQFDDMKKTGKAATQMSKDEYVWTEVCMLKSAQQAYPGKCLSGRDKPSKYNFRSITSVVTKGYKDEKTKPRQISPNKKMGEIEAWVSPYGYIHAKVKTRKDPSTGLGAGFEWVYVGDYYIDFDKLSQYRTEPVGPSDTFKVKNNKFNKSSAKNHNELPPVTIDSLKKERTMPSPDRDALLGRGEFGKGSVDVQDPMFESMLIDIIKDELKLS